MEDMMPKLFNPLPVEALRQHGVEPPIAARGKVSTEMTRVAVYDDRKRRALRIRVHVPAHIGVGRWIGVGWKTLGPDSWELYEDPSSKRKWGKGDQVGSLKTEYLNLVGLDCAPFGSSPAEVVEVDGRLLITCREADRVPVAPPLGLRKPKSAITPRPNISAEPIINTVTPIPEGVSRRERMLAVLREVDAIERETDWRLARVKEEGCARVWEWRASPLRLDEQNARTRMR